MTSTARRNRLTKTVEVPNLIPMAHHPRSLLLPCYRSRRCTHALRSCVRPPRTSLVRTRASLPPLPSLDPHPDPPVVSLADWPGSRRMTFPTNCCTSSPRCVATLCLCWVLSVLKLWVDALLDTRRIACLGWHEGLCRLWLVERWGIV